MEDRFVHYRFLHDTVKKFTLCVLDGGYVGKAECGKKDQFSRRAGRKVSLAKALKQTRLSKEERKGIWEDYFNEHPKDRE